MKTQHTCFGCAPLHQNDLKLHKLANSQSEPNSDVNGNSELRLRCYYALFVLMSNGYLQVEDMKNPPGKYAILLSRDVFEYVCKDDFDLLNDRRLITKSLTKSYVDSEVYEISEIGKNYAQVAFLSSQEVDCN